MIRDMGARRLCDAWGLFRSKSSPLWPRFGLYSPIYTPFSSLQDPTALITRTPASLGQFTAQSQSQIDDRSSRGCGWGLLFWSLSCRGESWDSEFTPLEGVSALGSGGWALQVSSLEAAPRQVVTGSGGVVGGAGFALCCWVRGQPRASLLPSSDPGALLSGCWAWKVSRVASGRLKVTHSPLIPAPPTLSQKGRKWACCFKGKDGQTVHVGNDNSQAFNKYLHVGKLVYHCELDRFLILKDFLMGLTVMLTNVTSLMLYNKICQHL